MVRGIAPVSSRQVAIRHLGEQDSVQDIVWALTDRVSFRTWNAGGLRSRSLRDYYDGFRFRNSGQLPEPYGELYRSHSERNEYTVFIGDTPVAWFHSGLGWVVPKLGGFTDERLQADYDKVFAAVTAITGKGSVQ